MNITIRKASIKDVESLQLLNKEIFEDNYKYDDDLILDWSLSEKGKKYFLEKLSRERAVCFIAEDKERPIGYAACNARDFGYRKKKYLEIENIGVSPAYRSKGVGRQLVDEVKKWAKTNGYDRLYVNAYIDNIKAVAFYKRNGFAEIDVSLQADT